MRYIRKLAERLNLAGMNSFGQLSSTSYCLANPCQEYVVFFPKGGTATLDLRGERVEYVVEWFIPILDPTLLGEEPLKGGDFQVLTAPFTGDAVLYLKRK